MAGKAGRGEGGRKGRTSVAEEAGCEEEDACFCRLQPGAESGCVSTHERRGSTTGPEKRTKMVLQVPKLGAASIWELDHRYVLLATWTRSVQHLRHSVGDIESFSGGRTPVCSSGNDPIRYGGSPTSSSVMSHCFCMFWGK